MSLNLNGSLQKYESDSNDAFYKAMTSNTATQYSQTGQQLDFSIVNFSAVLQICFENCTMLTGHLSKNGFLFFCPPCCCSIIQHMLYNIWFNLVLCGFLLLISCYRVQSKYYFLNQFILTMYSPFKWMVEMCNLHVCWMNDSSARSSRGQQVIH